MAFVELGTSAAASEATLQGRQGPGGCADLAGQQPQRLLGRLEYQHCLPLASAHIPRIGHSCLRVWWPLPVGSARRARGSSGLGKVNPSPPLLIKVLVPQGTASAHTNHSLLRPPGNSSMAIKGSFLVAVLLCLTHSLRP